MDPAALLKYGAIGLAAILAILSYRLLKNEQSKEEARPNIIVSIYVFMLFSLSLAILGSALELYKLQSSSQLNQEITDYKEKINKHQFLVKDIDDKIHFKEFLELCNPATSQNVKNIIRDIVKQLKKAREDGLLLGDPNPEFNCP